MMYNLGSLMLHLHRSNFARLDGRKSSDWSVLSSHFLKRKGDAIIQNAINKNQTLMCLMFNVTMGPNLSPKPLMKGRPVLLKKT